MALLHAVAERELGCKVCEPSCAVSHVNHACCPINHDTLYSELVCCPSHLRSIICSGRPRAQATRAASIALHGTAMARGLLVYQMTAWLCYGTTPTHADPLLLCRRVTHPTSLASHSSQTPTTAFS